MKVSEPVDLASLAAIWAERWLAYGGSLLLKVDSDKLTTSMRMASWRRLPPDQQPPYYWQKRWHEAWNVGRWRELNELAGLVPGLQNAIRLHVASVGKLSFDEQGQRYYVLSPDRIEKDAA